MFTQIAPSDWVRYIVSNHERFNTPEALCKILDQFKIKAVDVNLAQEAWWSTNNWWDDHVFIDALSQVGVIIPKEIRIRLK